MKGSGPSKIAPLSTVKISGLENNFVTVSHIKLTLAAVFGGAADNWNVRRDHLLNGNQARAVICGHFLQIHGCHFAYERIKLGIPLLKGTYVKPSIKSIWFGAALNISLTKIQQVYNPHVAAARHRHHPFIFHIKE